jgi:LacI family transcriptional regulator
MPLTLEDIAKLAGVNSSTVSRAINMPEMVKPKTRQKIEAIIKAKGYKPNYFARGLARGLTDSVGILTSFNTNPYIIEIIETIENQLAPLGTFMYLCNCQHSLELEKKYLDDLMYRKVDSLFVIETPSLNSTNNFYTSSSFPCPVILINQHKKPYGDNFVICCDQRPGLLEVFDEVQTKGLFPFILLIPEDTSYTFTLKEKLFNLWRNEHAIGQEKARIVKVKNLFDPNNEKSVWQSCESAKELFDESLRPRSILAGNDLMALGVLAAAREKGISVPEELSIAGVDNTYISRISIPSMSTIDLKMGEIGIKAAELYKELREKSPAQHLRQRKKAFTVASSFCKRDTF